MDDKTILKCASLILNKVAEESPTGDIKIKIKGKKVVLKYTELANKLSNLIESIQNEEKAIVNTCKTCEFIKFNDRGDKAMCYPQNYTGWRIPTDHCLLHKMRR